MNSYIKTLVYMFKRFKKSYLILIAILLGITIFSKTMWLLFSNGSQGMNNSFDFAFLIYTFVFFIAMFKESFNHLSMNGVTRKTFFIANSIFLLFVSLAIEITSIAFIGINGLLGIHSKLLLDMIYQCSFFEIIILGLCVSILASFIGWLCSMLTYRFGNYMILVIVFVPQILLTIFGAVISKADKAEEISYLMRYYFGFANGPQPLIACTNLIITAAVIAIINWAFMRKLAVRV